MRRSTLFLAFASLCACSSSDFSVGADDAGADAADATPADTAPSDTGPSATPPADAKPSSFGCREPGDCSPAAKHCCADLELGAGTMPSCPLTTSATACAASCTTNIPFSCPATGKVKLCKKPEDCAGDTANPHCCTIAASGASAAFCVSDLVKSYAISCL